MKTNTLKYTVVKSFREKGITYKVITTIEKRINKATKEKDVKLAILGAGLLSDNYIYYVEGNNVVFNYYSYHDKVTEEEYNNMLKNIDYSLLPEGIKFEFK